MEVIDFTKDDDEEGEAAPVELAMSFLTDMAENGLVPVRSMIVYVGMDGRVYYRADEHTDAAEIIAMAQSVSLAATWHITGDEVE